MKKLIALSLAAASCLMLSSNAMALPANLNMRADGSQATHPAQCYLIANNDGVAGSCDYLCDIRGPLPQSPSLQITFREWKTFLNSSCFSNAGRFVQTFLELGPSVGTPQMIFDQWDYPAVVVSYLGSETGGRAVVANIPGIAIGLSLLQ